MVSLAWLAWWLIGSIILGMIDKNGEVLKWAKTGPMGLGPTIAVTIWPYLVYLRFRWR